MVELYPYQKDLLHQAETALTRPKARVMMQLPTGGGKTRIAGELLAEWLKDGRKAVWLTHREELAEQTCRMLTDSGVHAIVVNRKTWSSGYDAPSNHNGVVILMAQTVGRRTSKRNIWGNYGSNDLLVIDEAHHAIADGYKRGINQWPGQAIGLTATPWRLSKTDRFDPLFKELFPGPQVVQLQDWGWLCESRTLMLHPEDIIRGGDIADGDYTPSGIMRANRDHYDVLTAGALRFWQSHAAERQTIIYAISKVHASNLTAVFKDEGIPAAVMLSDTPLEERARAIEMFRNGTLRVLVNVAVATEGFDLPDASSIVLTRPTKSLALYLQMVGRGLRRKADGGDCLILDLAGNAGIHGLPEENREWSLQPRGISSDGDEPAVWCGECNGVSPAASHFCRHCNSPLGQDCGRCGKWRTMRRWALADGCAHQHDVVCDLCHLDAHMAANLPESRELRQAAIDPLLFALVDEVWRNLISDNTRERELNELIAQRERENSDNADLERLFDDYTASLPIEEQPTSNHAIGIMVNDWEIQRQGELDRWNEEFAELKSKTAIEDKVRSGCYEQLERAENSLFHGGDDLIKDNFLYLTLFNEEWERLPNASKSRLKELQEELVQLIKDGRQDIMDRAFSEEFSRLYKPASDALSSRLITMRRQLETRWAEIWAEYQQSLE